MLKFRTLDAERATHPAWIHRFSAFLRRIGADELPQLWNVVRGDMSLVGPRPALPVIVNGYSKLRRKCVLIRPGITGLWQIRGELPLRLRDIGTYDLYYLRRASFTFDLWIALRTLGLFLGRRRIDYFASSSDQSEHAEP